MAKRRREGQPGFVAVEGPLAVGKHAVARRLATSSGARLVDTDPESNPFLARALAEPDRYGFPAQMYFLLARHGEQDALRQGDLFERQVVACGSFFRDRVFAEAFLPSEELSLYARIHAELSPRVVSPDLLVLLRASPDRILARLRARHRPYEVPLDGARVGRLCALFSEFAEGWRGAPLLQVDVGDVELDERDDLVASLQHEILKASDELGPDQRRRLQL